MKTKRTAARVLVVAVLLLIAGIDCWAAPNRISCPVLIGPPGVRFFTIPLMNKDIPLDGPVMVTVKRYAAGSPWSGESMDGTRYMGTEENGVKSKEITVAICSPAYLEVDGEKLLFYKHIGKKALWTGKGEFGRYYYQSIAENKFVKIGVETEEYHELGGMATLMTKGMGRDEKWTGAFGDTVYQLDSAGKGVQVGLIDYYWITPVGGTRLSLPVLMSKGMGKTDKWCGELDGTIYLEK